MKVLALCGESDTGKTSTLRLVARKMKDKYGCPDYSNDYFCNHIKNDYGEIWAVFKLKTKNIVIFITTRGDYPKIIKDDLNSARKQYQGKIDLIVCAMHDTPLFLNRMKKLSDGNLDIIDKQVSTKSEEAACNEACATAIFEKIENFIKAYN